MTDDSLHILEHDCYRPPTMCLWRVRSQPSWGRGCASDHPSPIQQ